MSDPTSRVDRVLEGMSVWAGYYRENIDIFVEEYLCIKLKLFQRFLLVWMNISNFFCFTAARGLGKSFLTAIFCCARCILYPGTKVCIASGTRSQSINVLEKIRDELMPASENLCNEIEDIRISSTDSWIMFKNGSRVKVVTAGDSSRGNRANILICDEFRLIALDVVDTILKRFLTSPRMPGYLSNPEYAHLAERNKELYLSSAYFKSHWSYEKVKSFTKNIVDDTKKYFVCGLPYQLSITEKLLDADAVRDEMSEVGFSETKWSMEMECMWFGDSEGNFFDFESIAKNRAIQYAMLPNDLAMKIGDTKHFGIPKKQPGEIRIISADIALMSSKKNNNDATAIFVNQLIPNSNKRYKNNIVYTEAFEGAHTADQALKVRKLYDEYECDYIVLDVRGVGAGIYDCLVRDITDPDTGEVYYPLSCCNNDELAARCADRSAPKVIWGINANAKFNSDCAIMLREGFRAGKIKLLVSEYDADEIFGDVKGYKALSPVLKLKAQLPYVNTTLLINELINLQHDESSGLVKISEKSTARKDRYSSLSYNYWVANQLENKLNKKKDSSVMERSFFVRTPDISNAGVFHRR